MRHMLLGLWFISVVLSVRPAAQVFLLPTSPPTITAASADWQINGEPLLYAGDTYDPAGPTVFFNGNTMSQVAWYRGIPVYADATLPPYTIAYVPIGRGLMKPYQRRTASGQVGLPIQGNYPLSFQPSIGNVVAAISSPPSPTIGTAGIGGITRESLTCSPEQVIALLSGCAVGTGGAAQARTDQTQPAPAPVVGATNLESIPPPSGNIGIWIEYGGQRWQSAGSAVRFDADRFKQIGTYKDIPVYRANIGGDSIYVPAVTGGPVAPFRLLPR